MIAFDDTRVDSHTGDTNDTVLVTGQHSSHSVRKTRFRQINARREDCTVRPTQPTNSNSLTRQGRGGGCPGSEFDRLAEDRQVVSRHFSRADHLIANGYPTGEGHSGAGLNFDGHHLAYGQRAAPPITSQYSYRYISFVGDTLPVDADARESGNGPDESGAADSFVVTGHQSRSTDAFVIARDQPRAANAFVIADGGH